MKTEIDYLNKVFTPEKLDQFSKIDRSIENIETG